MTSGSTTTHCTASPRATRSFASCSRSIHSAGRSSFAGDKSGISQIENGKAVSHDVLRSYVTGLGGHVEIVARFGDDIQLNVA